MITLFLGAGFSAVAGVPLARGLFDEEPVVDRITRRNLVARVLANWQAWRGRHNGAPEEYLAHLQQSGGKDWLNTVWYVSLVIALKMGRVELVGGKPTIVRHNIARTTGVAAHEEFWNRVFRHTNSVCIITTNYDILIERGLRHQPRPTIRRPGFHYGDGPEYLEGGGYPSYAHIQRIFIKGEVPVLKLHGSVSWSFRKDKLLYYHDCRPAIRGDAALIAPVTDKSLPDYLKPVWDKARAALTLSSRWVFVGYSLPSYDHLVLDLLQSVSSHYPDVHVFDPNPAVADHFHQLLGLNVVPHPGLPEGLQDLQDVMGYGNVEG